MAGNGKYKYWISEEGLLLIEGWAKDGLTDKQIAAKIGISKQTFYDWQKRYPDFSDSLKRGKEVIDRKVENALLKRALGYSYDEITEITDEKGRTTTKVITKQVIPDTTAQIFWLKNRKPNEWREKREVEINNEQQSSAMNQLIQSLNQARGDK
nr:MAG TPA: terminase small subunit [Caudoviricetes sp.]